MGLLYEGTLTEEAAIEGMFSQNGLNIPLTNNAKAKIEVFPNLNHLFQEADTGIPDENARLSDAFSGRVMNSITNWINDQL